MSFDTVKIKLPKRAFMGVLCVFAGALSPAVAQVFADGDPATSDVTSGDFIMPYDGFLQVDATSVHGTKTLRFELFESATGGVAEWSEEQNVTMYNGRFSVGLGAVTQLNATLLDAQRLWLGITVLEDDGQGGVTEVALSGRQSIEPAPYAAWSAHAADFQVAGDLDVAGNALVAADFRVDNNIFIDGEELSFDDNTAAGLGDGGRAIFSDGADGLIVNPAGDFSGGVEVLTPEFSVPNLQVNGDTTVQGDWEQSNRNVAAHALDTPLLEFQDPRSSTLETSRFVSSNAQEMSISVLDRRGQELRAIHINSDSNVTIENDLTITGDSDLSTSSEYELVALDAMDTATNSRDLVGQNISAFCFLTGVEIDHETLPFSTGGIGCSVSEEFISPTVRKWRMYAQGNGSVTCWARCINQ